MKILFTGSSGPKVGATVAAQLATTYDIVGVDLLAGAHTHYLQPSNTHTHTQYLKENCYGAHIGRCFFLSPMLLPLYNII